MNKQQIMDALEDEDFLIRVRPFADDNGSWSGEIDISIMAFENNPMDDEDFSQVMHFTKMMCATVPIMEQEENIRDLVNEYIINMFDNETGFDVELEEECGVTKTYDNNVVHISFNTKTKGSA